jgi:hypothetical protein
MMIDLGDWDVRGSYFESCNCEVICPCRSIGGRPGGASTYGECFGVLSWFLEDGSVSELDLSGLAVVMALRYEDAVQPATPWEVVLYVDDRASQHQHDALVAIFLGRAGGGTLRNFAHLIGPVHAVRSARISLDHGTRTKRIGVNGFLSVEAARTVPDQEEVLCGIPGFDHPGEEMIADRNRSVDPELSWDIHDTAAYAGDFHYRSSDS